MLVTVHFTDQFSRMVPVVENPSLLNTSIRLCELKKLKLDTWLVSGGHNVSLTALVPSGSFFNHFSLIMRHCWSIS